MEIIETSVFEYEAQRIFNEHEYLALINHLACCPDSGKVIPGSGGLRKFRWQASGHGKRGGARIIYYWYTQHYQIILLRAYLKTEMEDLSVEQLRRLKSII